MKNLKYSLLAFLLLKVLILRGQDTIPSLEARNAVHLAPITGLNMNSVGISYERILGGRTRKVLSVGFSGGNKKRQFFNAIHRGAHYRGDLGLSYLLGNHVKGKYLELTGKYIYANDPNNGISPLGTAYSQANPTNGAIPNHGSRVSTHLLNFRIGYRRHKSEGGFIFKTGMSVFTIANRKGLAYNGWSTISDFPSSDEKWSVLPASYYVSFGWGF